jgi:hypothetical protein
MVRGDAACGRPDSETVAAEAGASVSRRAVTAMPNAVERCRGIRHPSSAADATGVSTEPWS